MKLIIIGLLLSLVALLWALAGQPWPESPPPSVIYIEPAVGLPDPHYTYGDSAL